MTTSLIDPYEFTACVSKMRRFFEDKGFLEVHTQSRLSILAACEIRRRSPLTTMRARDGRCRRRARCGWNTNC
jgi:elongation factor P--beta-lysine ligase